MMSSESLTLTPQTPAPTSRPAWRSASISYVGLLIVMWLAGHYFRVLKPGAPVAAIVASFAVLLAPFWFFGFGVAESLRAIMPRWSRVLAPGLLVSSYLIFALATHTFHWYFALPLFAMPVVIAAVLESVPCASGDVTPLLWQDVVAMALLAAPILWGWFRGAWAMAGMGGMPKLLFTDAGLIAYLLSRPLPTDDVGYDFRPHLTDVTTGLREWLFFAPIGIGFGLALGFISFYPRVPPLANALGGWLVTFVLVAVPEELFFRGLLMNLLQTRMSRTAALLLSAVLFGLSHYPKGAIFNWRYVIMASIAGVFYGRAWRQRRRIFASAITHTCVDVVWSLWFR
jgi:membrane protease YdiL (CAAX protease family)